MIAGLLLLLSAATAADHHVMRAGETIDQIAAELGDPALAAAIRAANGLGPDEEPVTGIILDLPPSGAGGEDQSAVVVALTGIAEATPPRGAPAPVTLGQRLAPGTLVCTRPDAYATIRLAVSDGGRDHDDVSLLGQTCLTLDSAVSLGARRSSFVSLREGSLRVRSAEASPGQVTIRTAAGVTTGDRGGFRVTVEPEAARTEAVDGAVSVLGGGSEVAVAAGQGTRVRPGEAPEAPVPLLPPVHEARPEDGVALRRPEFTWGRVERALTYNVEIATDPAFSESVIREPIAGVLWEPDTLFVPYRVPGLWWRVTAVDRVDFEGLPCDPRALLFPTGVGP